MTFNVVLHRLAKYYNIAATSSAVAVRRLQWLPYLDTNLTLHEISHKGLPVPSLKDAESQNSSKSHSCTSLHVMSAP